MNYFLGTNHGLVLIGLVLFVLLLFWHKSKANPKITDQGLYEKGWWVIITTEQPNYKYSFGPFDQRREAVANQSGYVKDLYDEGATQINSIIRWYPPKEISIDLRSPSI